MAERYALLIGVNDGGSGTEQLRYAVEDARQFRNVLIENGGFLQENTKMLSNPRSSDLLREISNFQNLAKNGQNRKDDLFVFYYSGHASSTALKFRDGEINLSILKNFLVSSLFGIRIGIIDACRSGQLTRYKGGRKAEPIAFDFAKKTEGMVLLTSASTNEDAQESDEYRASIFTYHLINALNGSADVSGDGQVSLDEAYNYVYSKTVESTAFSKAGTQHPSYAYNIIGEGDIVLTNFGKSSCGINFDIGCSGQYLIVDKNRRVICADFYLAQGKRHFIAVRPGIYSVVRGEKNGQISLVEIDISESEIRTVTPKEFSVVRSIPYLLKGVSHKLLEPYANGSNADFSNRFGIGVAFGEGNNGFGPVLSYNLNRNQQFSVNLGLLMSDIDSNGLPTQESMLTSFAYRHYYKWLYAGSGMTLGKGFSLSIDKSHIKYYGIGLPLWFGAEYGSRNRLFISISTGYIFMTTIVKNNLDNKIIIDNSKQRFYSNSSSFGVRLGYYFK